MKAILTSVALTVCLAHSLPSHASSCEQITPSRLDGVTAGIQLARSALVNDETWMTAQGALLPASFPDLPRTGTYAGDNALNEWVRFRGYVNNHLSGNEITPYGGYTVHEGTMNTVRAIYEMRHWAQLSHMYVTGYGVAAGPYARQAVTLLNELAREVDTIASLAGRCAIGE